MGLWRDSSAEDDDLLASNDDKDNKTIKSQDNPEEEEEESDEVGLEMKATSSTIKEEAKNEIDKFNQEDSESDAEQNNQTELENNSSSKKAQIKSEFACIRFYQELSSKCYAVVVDCYAKMFLCDFINCIITIFTYQYFGV